MKRPSDIERLISSAEQYEPPTAQQLAEAPLLEHWGLLHDVEDPDDLPVVMGSVTGHPLAPDGGLHFAAKCYAMAPDRSWVATMARLYRLGEPARNYETTEDGDDN